MDRVYILKRDDKTMILKRVTFTLSKVRIPDVV